MMLRVAAFARRIPQHQPQRPFCRSLYSAAVGKRLENMMKRHAEITEIQSSGRSTGMSIGQEFSRLSRVASLVQERDDLDAEKESIQDLLTEALEANDKELEKECQGELELIQQKRECIDKTLVDAVIPKDDDDYESDAIVEVRAGTGGDEASLFAAALFETYRVTAQSLNWKVEILNQSKTEIGGLREGALSITGSPSFRIPSDTSDEQTSDGELIGPYGVFKFESGGHRVQRVPVNDSRIHTSACSVAVLPSFADTNEFAIPPNELKIETMKASGAGGQHVNTTDSAVRVTHIPTGITASIQDERTQHRNKDKALKLIAARVRDRQRAEEERVRGETRSSLMGGGDRSERIRTYNFPQDRVTDHRSKSSKHGIEALLNGGVEGGLVVTFLPSLKNLRREELLQQLEDGPGDA